MNQGEFYSAKEYNATSEYKHFPAEIYRKPREENQCGKEDAELGKEITSLQPNPKKRKKSGETNTLLDKLFNSLRGAATAATVATAAVAVTTTVITGTPQVELVKIECGDTYVEYEMQVSELDEDGEYAIVLSTSNQDDVKTEVDGDGTYEGTVQGLTPEWEYTLAFVQYDSVLGEIRRFETKLQTLKHSPQDPIPPPEPEPEPEPEPIPSVTVTGVEIVGINKVRLDFTHVDLPNNSEVELDIVFGDSTADKITLTDGDLERGYTFITVETSATLTVTPTVTFNRNGVEEKTVCTEYTHTFDKTLYVEAMVGLHSGHKAITFYPTGIACGATNMTVTSSLDPVFSEALWFEEAAQLWYDTEGIITYTLYLSNDDGDILSNEVSITVDTSVLAPDVEYHFESQNPGNMGVTYNEDGTVNLYITTDFTSSSEDIYYQITLDGIRYTFREPVARIENIPDESYAVTYDVCVDIDGMQYSIYHTTPSGVANESWIYINSNFESNVLTLEIDPELIHLDPTTLKLISSAGEEIVLTESDLVYDEEKGTYSVEVRFSEYAEEVTVYLIANPYYSGLNNVDAPIGNTTKIFEVTVYQY